MPNKTYDVTLLEVQAYWETLDLPFRFIWLDSWFYYKGANGGTKNWTAMPSAFQFGLPDFHQKLQLPIIAHNRWWSAEVSYATQNGGQYNFVTEPKTSTWAVPTDQRFWDDLFFNSSQWGLRVYQQDWLYNEFETVIALTTQLDLARQWLMQMGQGASKAGLSVMYCMPAPRHVLQSLEIPAVKQVRASDDYIPGNTKWHNWQTALTSLLEWSIGLAPSKDDFWTTTTQPGSIYPNGSEPDPPLQSLMATIATGQVTPSDGIGFMSAELVRRSIRADGLILKPDRPAWFPDTQYAAVAFTSAASDDYIAYTYSLHGEWVWVYDVIVNLDVGRPSTPHRLGDLLPLPALRRGGEYIARRQTRRGWEEGQGQRVGVQHVIQGVEEGADAWELVTISPVMTLGNVSLILQGESDKWIAMSRQRVREITLGQTLQVALMGQVGEVVRMWYQFTMSVGVEAPLAMVYAGCRIAATNTATLTVAFSNPGVWTCGEGQVVPTPPTGRETRGQVAAE